jgi:hypothetical protein
LLDKGLARGQEVITSPMKMLAASAMHALDCF